MLIIDEIKAFLEAFFVGLPNSRICNKFRNIYWRKRLGVKVDLLRGSKISSTDKIHIGENVSFGENVIIDNHNSYGFYMGSNIAVARGSYFRTANHKFDDPTKPIRELGHTARKILYKEETYSIVIEDDVWIGANCIFLSGALIGKGSVVAAGSVVTRGRIPEFSIVAGNLAKVLRKRK